MGGEQNGYRQIIFSSIVPILLNYTHNHASRENLFKAICNIVISLMFCFDLKSLDIGNTFHILNYLIQIINKNKSSWKPWGY